MGGSLFAEQFAAILVNEMQPGAGETDERLIGIRVVGWRDFRQPMLHGGAEARACEKDVSTHFSIMRRPPVGSLPYVCVVPALRA